VSSICLPTYWYFSEW